MNDSGFTNSRNALLAQECLPLNYDHARFIEKQAYRPDSYHQE